MDRGFNFGAGPAMLPEEILIEAQQELLNWQNKGLSIMELGHRTPEFIALMEEAEYDLRSLLNIPGHYHVLFLGGAARTQFAMIPLNLLEKHQQAGYLITGLWSSMALTEAKNIANAYSLASGEPFQFRQVPDQNAYDLKDDTQYIYYTPNETVNGVQVFVPPKINGLPIIADMTSCLLTEPINVEDYALIFAGAQKNIANAGLTLVIIREDLAERAKSKSLPLMFDYNTHIQHRSLYATPPTFNCYLASKMFKWIRRQGGVAALHQQSIKKASRLYDYIDSSEFYQCKINTNCRSLINICFSTPNSHLDEQFALKAAEHNLLALKGHRTVGGLRASLYNAMPLAGVDELIEFMKGFSREHPL